MDLSIGQMREDEWEQVAALRSSAFAGPVQPDPDRPRLGPSNVQVARLKGAVVATAAGEDFTQHFAGAELAMCGVTGVVVAPHVAGQGLAKTLLGHVLERATKLGQPVSCLYPSTSKLYRSMGYESAGIWAQHAILLSEVHSLPPDGVTVDLAGPEVYDDLRHIHELQAAETNGWIGRSEWWWGYLKHNAVSTKKHQRIFVASNSQGPCAVAVVRHTDSSPLETAHYDFDIVDLFGSPDGFIAIAAALRTQSTVAGRVLTTIPYPEIDALTERPETSRRTNQMPWMERILNVIDALQARPVGPIESPIFLTITDPLIEANNATFVLEAAERDNTTVSPRLVVTRARAAVGRTAEMTVGTLAPLFTGYRSATQLASAGQISGASTVELAALDRCFATQHPTLIDFI